MPFLLLGAAERTTEKVLFSLLDSLKGQSLFGFGLGFFVGFFVFFCFLRFGSQHSGTNN